MRGGIKMNHIYEFANRFSEYIANLITYRDAVIGSKYQDFDISDLPLIEDKNDDTYLIQDRSKVGALKEGVDIFEMHVDSLKLSEAIVWSPELMR